ncbi:restriction endonuclease subunit S [uncultured Chitinophaga sp.]|jgi:Restriction endonuclease S subunits|uniref:restriction endonuclease subunit S n=1 Tax=uncultured Chitinophaga sp. TaxID=339340 RepID=UPI002635CDC9|nr:restriction endonuclease subunit S [uncultured Chitinophaga sp.]
MNNWHQTSIGDFIDFNPSESLPKNRLAKKIPMEKLGTFERKLKGFEYAEYKSGPKFRNGDTLVAKITPCLENGKTAYVDILNEGEVAYGSSEFIVLRENGHSDKKFIYYLARSPLFRERAISCMEGTSGRKRVNEGALKRQEIVVPDLIEQQKIAAVLSALDDKIELNNRINAELEQMAKMLYDYWFVQFDFPDANGKPYKSTGGKMVYDEVLKREIPKGWNVTVFNDWIAATKAGDWGKETQEGNYTERVYCIRGADINGLNGKGEIKSPGRFILKNNRSKILNPNDFIVEISGGSPTQSTARIALLTEKTFERFDADVICSNFCKAVSIRDKKYIFNFLQEWQRLYDSGVFFGYEGKTSGIKNFLFDSFMASYHVVFPDKEIVEKYYEFAKPLEEKRQSNLHQNLQLSALRDWLLPMLMNGQIKVVDVGKEYNLEKEQATSAAKPLNTYGELPKLNIPESRKNFAKQVLAGKIVSEFRNDPNFTDIKFQKIQFLAEHIIKADLKLNYYYQAAGPYDNVFMHTIYNDFRKQKWFDYQNKRFVPLEKQGNIEEYYQGYFGPAHEQLNKLFELLYQTTEAEAEIIATLYAVWNNRIIEKRTITDKELVRDFYQWSDRKRQYSEVQVAEGLEWLRTHQMEPKGFGKLIKKAKGKK